MKIEKHVFCKEYRISRQVYGQPFSVEVKPKTWRFKNKEFVSFDYVKISHGDMQCMFDGKAVDIILKALRKSGDTRVSK